MNWLDFIAAIVKSIAWPLVVAFGIFTFRRQLGKLLSSLSELSVSKEGLKGKFDQRLIETKREINEVKVEIAASLPPNSRRLLDAKEEFSANIGRIVSAWNELEEILRRRLMRAGSDPSSLGASAMLQLAFERNLITDMERKSLLGLNTMRNLAVHGRTIDIDAKRTQDFLSLVDAIKTVLQITEQ
jgi:hypothetical protein